MLVVIPRKGQQTLKLSLGINKEEILPEQDLSALVFLQAVSQGPCQMGKYCTLTTHHADSKVYHLNVSLGVTLASFGLWDHTIDTESVNIQYLN